MLQLRVLYVLTKVRLKYNINIMPELENKMSPTERFESYKRHRELKISLRNHMLHVFRDVIPPYTTIQTAKDWLDAPCRSLGDKKPRDYFTEEYLNSDDMRGRLIHPVDSALCGIESGAYA